MNAERLTTMSREVITTAVANATQRGHATVEPWHLLLALLDTGGSTAAGLLRAVGANPADIRRAALHAVERLAPGRRPRPGPPPAGAPAPAARAWPSPTSPASSPTRSRPPSRSRARWAMSTRRPSTC